MGIWQLGCYLLFFGLMASFQLPEAQQSLMQQREPASFAVNCTEDMKFFLSKRTWILKAFSKLKRMKSGHKLDNRKLAFYREEYARGVGEESINFRDVNPSSEGLIAYIEAVNKSLGGDHIPEIRKMNYFRRAKVSKIVDILNSDGKLLMNDIENLIGDLYLAVYGPSMKTNEVLFEDNIEKRVLARVIQEDMAARGLSNIFTKYKILGKKKTWAQKVVRSGTGRFLGTGIMNMGTLFGLPPIYLPNLKPIKIPDFMVDDLIMNGLTDEMTKKLEQEIGRQLGDKLTFNLQNRARYKLFRRYYMAGMSAYLTYMIVTEFNESNALLDEEAATLEELAREMTSSLEAAVELEAKGYDIFEKSDTEIAKTNRWCRAIQECLADEAIDLDHAIEKGSDTYKACKDFMDPQNLCPNI